MSDKSEILVLENILNYASQEARRLGVSGIVLECLRLAADELGRPDAHASTRFLGGTSLH